MGNTAKIRHRARRRRRAGAWRLAALARWPELAKAGFEPVRWKGNEIFWTTGGDALIATSAPSSERLPPEGLPSEPPGKP